MCGAATCDLNHYHNELHTFRGETEHIDDIAEMNDGYAVAGCRCRHDMMKVQKRTSQ